MSENMYAQVPLEDIALVDNPQNRCPCLLLLDTSGSMSGAPIAQLNAGLTQLVQELRADSLAAKRVEVSIVTFGPVQTICDFTTVDQFNPPPLSTTGLTPTGEAITYGLGKVNERVQQYRQYGVPSYRPWIFLITDGAPTDDWQQAAAEVRAGDGKKFEFFGVGVDGADMQTLARISPRTAALTGLNFVDLFKWISQSMKAVSRSVAGDNVDLPQVSWGTIKT